MNSVGKCSLCDYVGNNTHIHHIIPRSRGGSDDDSNLIELCTVCHGKAHDISHGGDNGTVKMGIKRGIELEEVCLNFIDTNEIEFENFLCGFSTEYGSTILHDMLIYNMVGGSDIFNFMKYGSSNKRVNKFGRIPKLVNAFYKENNFGIDLGFLDKYEH